jgi:putative isomerase
LPSSSVLSAGAGGLPPQGFSTKISPTSFYPLMANASTDAQATAMVTHWLTNKSRFCINPNYETENEGRCYWGLPSISADDPTFPPLGYWRGE